jgi:hypothetical protein
MVVSIFNAEHGHALESGGQWYFKLHDYINS